ncbi:transposase [Actinospica sp. MGRD01-02]|uniref:Transposase n=1 Tax=Actinospica acidithermotolerans TaxID=2828514 RepID=A0A941IGY2_9ACTN|nr:transposase [Actinospica acidithermotolerans]MBR7827910.1 transposase [Actinospica acidithermotolerans]
MTLPASLLAVLENLRGSFTAPTFATFAAMVTGLIAQTGKGTVTGMLTGAGLARAWSHDRAHAFFSRSAWNAEILGIVLAHLIVRTLLPSGAVVTVAVDDTLFKRRGKKVFGAAWQHDGAATGEKQVGRGTCFVVVGIIVELPFLTRPVCLPVMARLWRPKTGPSKVELAASMIRLLSVCLNRPLHVVADAAYHGKALRHLPASITVTTRLPKSAVLYDLAPPPTGKRGRPALKGERLGTAAQSAATAHFTTAQVNRYGRTDAVRIAEIRCLWYGSFHTQVVRVILLREPGTDTGYDLALVSTDLHSPAAALITRYAWRWSIEVTFSEAREHLGAGQARNRTENAVRRTVPFGLYCYTITVIWYTLHGHHPADAAARREQSPWYTSKTEPAFADMAAKLQRVIVAARFSAISPGRPTEAEIRAVQNAWAQAGLDLAA